MSMREMPIRLSKMRQTYRHKSHSVATNLISSVKVSHADRLAASPALVASIAICVAPHIAKRLNPALVDLPEICVAPALQSA
jgi:hypothetical protein